MAHINIFDRDAFSLVELTQTFENSEYLPQELAEEFKFKPVSTEKVAIEIKEGEITLIPTSERGSPIDEATGKRRKIVDLRTPRLAKGSTIKATEIANIRAFGKETELMQIGDLITERIEGLDDDLELSHEKMRLGALKGLVIDPKTEEVIYNMYKVLGVTQKPIIDFDLDLDKANPSKGALIKLCNKTTTEILQDSKGAVTPQTKIKGLVGSRFWNDLVTHPEVEKTYLNWVQAQDLRGDLQKPFSPFTFGGIEWKQYRGTDDNSKVSVGPDEAIIYPSKVKDNLIFTASPSDEHFEFVNTKGKRKYVLLEKDPSVNKKWVRPEIYSYPLFYCARPATLRRGKRT